MSEKTMASWIGGLMKETTNQTQPGCFSLIPTRSVEFQYLRTGRYIIQYDERGRKVGYLLHGRICEGSPVTIAQHAIIYDKWNRGHGERAVKKLISRAIRGGASSIWLRCAADLPAVRFWQSQGFCVIKATMPTGKRKRVKLIMVMAFAPELFRSIQTDELPKNMGQESQFWNNESEGMCGI